MLEITSTGPYETRAFGAVLGAALAPGDLVCLLGALGAGKTALAQGIAAGWGSPDRVTSPTFVLVNEYRRSHGGRFYHMDAYRLSGPAEAVDLDLDALLAAGPLVIEWAGRIREALPEAAFEIRILDLGGNARRFQITSSDSERLDALAMRTLRDLNTSREQAA